jgi:hypothetical protein
MNEEFCRFFFGAFDLQCDFLPENDHFKKEIREVSNRTATLCVANTNVTAASAKEHMSREAFVPKIAPFLNALVKFPLVFRCCMFTNPQLAAP